MLLHKGSLPELGLFGRLAEGSIPEARNGSFFFFLPPGGTLPDKLLPSLTSFNHALVDHGLYIRAFATLLSSAATFLYSQEFGSPDRPVCFTRFCTVKALLL